MENRPWTKIWKQIPVTTKLLSIILLGLMVILILLIFVRADGLLIRLPQLGDFIPFWNNQRIDIPPPPPSSPAATGNKDTRVFSGPGDDYSVLGSLAEDQKAEIVGVSVDSLWWAISIKSELYERGWISVDGVSAENTIGLPIIRVNKGTPEAGPPSNFPVFEEGTPVAIAIENIEIFYQPDQQSDTLGILEAGRQAEIVARSGDGRWWAIRMPYIDSGQGWVSAARVRVENSDNVPIFSDKYITPEPGEDIPVWTPTVTAVANVNVRSGPGLGYNKIDVLANGQSAEVTGKSPDGFWWAIKLPSDAAKLGWISMDYVVHRNTDSVPVIELRADEGFLIITTPAPNAPYLEAIAMINIRNGPGVEYPVLARLEPGQEAEVVGVSSNGSWYAIKVDGNKSGVGWVALVYVRAFDVDTVPTLLIVE
ncbi:SH3 domain-containing protein [Chloroflexota bacterium]